MLTCNKCGKQKLESDFNWNNSAGRYAYHCRACHSDYLKSHYARNKQYYKDKAKKRSDEARAWFKDFKATLKCKYCGENHPACLDFHHTNSNEKADEVSKMVGHSKAKLLKEASKCEVLCANCHRKLHWNEHESVAQRTE